METPSTEIFGEAISHGSFEHLAFLVRTENVRAFIESGAVENGIGDLN